MEKLYTMCLGENIHFSFWEITRVPGGWIFYSREANRLTSTFVPYNNEFDNRCIPPTPKAI